MTRSRVAPCGRLSQVGGALSLDVRFQRGVPTDVRELVLDTLPLFTVRHRLAVVVTSGIYICNAGGWFSEKLRGRPRIAVAGGVSRRMRHFSESRRVALAEVGRIVIHEFVHYEQFRDGRVLTERGVDSRAVALLRRIRPNLASVFDK